MIPNQFDSTADPEHAPRVTMDRETVADGVWWPRTIDPATEFPALLMAMGPIHRVSYNLDAWSPVGRKLNVGDTLVRMEGFHTMRRDIVTLIRLDDTRIQLRVVAPESEPPEPSEPAAAPHLATAELCAHDVAPAMPRPRKSATGSPRRRDKGGASPRR